VRKSKLVLHRRLENQGPECKRHELMTEKNLGLKMVELKLKTNVNHKLRRLERGLEPS